MVKNRRDARFAASWEINARVNAEQDPWRRANHIAEMTCKFPWAYVSSDEHGQAILMIDTLDNDARSTLVFGLTPNEVWICTQVQCIDDRRPQHEIDAHIEYWRVDDKDREMADANH